MCERASRPGTGSIAAGAFTDNGMHEWQVFMWEEPTAMARPMLQNLAWVNLTINIKKSIVS